METINLVNTMAKALEPKASSVAVSVAIPSAERVETKLTELNQPTFAGQVLPPEQVEGKGSEKDVIEEKVSELNSFVQNIQRGIQFSVDEDSGNSVITVTDKETGDVIRTFPSEEMLAISAQLNESLATQDGAGRGLLVNAKA